MMCSQINSAWLNCNKTSALLCAEGYYLANGMCISCSSVHSTWAACHNTLSIQYVTACISGYYV